MPGLFILDSVSTPTVAHMVHVHHHPGLVTLSLMVALVSSCTAFYMARANRMVAAVSHRQVALLCASLVLGFGIWAMHFIGMLAMELPTAVSYAPWPTALSILPGMLAALLALWSLQTPNPSGTRVLISGCTVGLGIGAMHYTGLAALEVPGRIHLHIPLFLLSLLAGLLLSLLAFALHRWLNRYDQSTLGRHWHLLPAFLMTAAIASMHYISMMALRFNLQPGASASQPTMTDSATLSLLIAGMSFVVILVLGLANLILRYRDMWKAVAARDARLNAMIDTATDGYISINEQGLILDFNPAAQRIFGYTREEILGRNISTLMPSPLAEQHDSHLRKHLSKPDKPISVNGREVLGQRKDGRHIPLQLAIGKAQTPAGTIFVGYLQDISERKRTDAQLRIAASVFQHVREGVAIVDANHNISDANPAFLQLTEKSREECMGKSLESLYEDADIPPDMSKLWQTVATQQYWQSETMFTRRNGSVWMQRLSISPVLNELQRPHHFIAVISDVSERPGLEVMLPHQDLHDSATGLPSHKLFMDRLSNALLSARKKNTHIGLLVAQLHLAETPPASGSDTDGALRLLGQLLQQQLRSTDTLARLSNDRLALLLPGIKDTASFEALVQRLSQSMSQAQASYGKYGVQALSVGVSVTLNATFNARELLEISLAQLQPLPQEHNPQPFI